MIDIEKVILDISPEIEFLDLGKHNMVYNFNDMVIKVNSYDDGEAKLINYLKNIIPEYFEKIDSYLLKIDDKMWPIVTMPKYKTLPNYVLNDGNVENICEFIEDKMLSEDNVKTCFEKCVTFYEDEIGDSVLTLDDIENVMDILFKLKENGIYLSDIKPCNFGYDDGAMTILDFGDYVYDKELDIQNTLIPVITKDELKNILLKNENCSKLNF